MKLQCTQCKFLTMQKYVKQNIEFFWVYFMKLDIFENFIGNILHPSKQRLLQIE